MVILKSVTITGIIMLLFYRSLWGILWFPMVCFFLLREENTASAKARKTQLQEEFLHGIGVLNSALQAGLSMENAWFEVEKETKLLYGGKSEFYQELHEMNRRVAHNMPIEKLFLEFAYKSKIDDIIQFAELFEFGKRSGSDWRKIIYMIAEQMTERQEARKQIEVVVAEKKMEQKIMNIMPLCVLAFLQFSAWDYMAVLYHNWFGVLAMTIFLLAYAGAIELSKKILKVEV